MIKANKIEVLVVEHFDNKGKSIGFLNEYENADLRCQIAEHKAEGYFLMFNAEKIEIDSSGRISNWPSGLYDVNEILLARLFSTSRTQNNNHGDT